jgi:hypothetical protein
MRKHRIIHKLEYIWGKYTKRLAVHSPLTDDRLASYGLLEKKALLILTVPFCYLILNIPGTYQH